jgi:hypothetical protein
MTVRSTQDPDRKLGRAAPLDELDRLVEIDVRASRERDGVVARETHAHELGCAPALYAVEFGLDDFVCRSIHPQYPFTLSGIWGEWISPSGGISARLLDKVCY